MNTLEQKTTGPTKTETLFGGKNLTVKMKDGASQEIVVRQLGIDECQKLFPALNSEPTMAEIYVGKETGWAKTVTRESVSEIIEEGERLNDDFFWPWAQRQIKRMEKIAPGTTANLMKASGLTSPIGSQK